MTTIDTAKTRDKSPREKEVVSRIGDKLAAAVEKAFQEAGLNSDKERDQHTLLGLLAWTVYVGKDPGAPQKWTKEKYRTLLTTVQKMRANDQHLTDLACCELLSRGKGGSDRYRDIKSKTLRRTLLRAKGLERAAKSIVAGSGT